MATSGEGAVLRKASLRRGHVSTELVREGLTLRDWQSFLRRREGQSAGPEGELCCEVWEEYTLRRPVRAAVPRKAWLAQS